MSSWKMVAMTIALLLGRAMLPSESGADFPPQWPTSGQMVWYRLNTGCTETVTSTTCPHALLYRTPDTNEVRGLVSDVKNTLSVWGVISGPVTTLKACASGGTFQCKVASASFQIKVDSFSGNVSSNVPNWPASFTITPTDNNGRFGGGVSPSDGIYFSEQWGIPFGSTTMQKLVNWDLEIFAMTDADNDTRLFLAMPLRDAVFPVEIAWGRQSAPLPGPITGYPTTFLPDLVFGCATNQGLPNPGCLDSKMSHAGFAKICPAITPIVNWWVDANSIPAGLGAVAGINGRAVKLTDTAIPGYVGLGPVSTSPPAFSCF